MREARARAALWSRDQTLAVRPMLESLAILSASSSSLKGTRATTGPKISSRMTGESGSALAEDDGGQEVALLELRVDWARGEDLGALGEAGVDLGLHESPSARSKSRQPMSHVEVRADADPQALDRAP